MAEAAKRVEVRSFRGVVDNVERRIFRVDRWRIPKPDGLSVRSIVYTIGIFIALMVVGRLPVIHQLLGVLPPSVRFVALPVLGGWGLSAWSPDGRAPHHALISALRLVRAPKHLAGLRPCPALGTELSAVAEVCIAAGVDEPRYRPGRIQGPASVTLRYPAKIEPQGAPRRFRGDAAAAAEHATRLVVTPVGRNVRAMARGHVIQVPAGKELVFEEAL